MPKEMMDLILLEMYLRVRSLENPEDNPVESVQVSHAIGILLDELVLTCDFLLEEGFLQVSTISTPPLLYLTHRGVARAKRLMAA